jgi:hypothetical protein
MEIFCKPWHRGDPIFDGDLPAFRIIDILVLFMSSRSSYMLEMKMMTIGQVAVVSHSMKQFVKK